jgi:Na+-transporting NADH:ubiquinone oxidoreductase subunit NqrB
MDVRATRRNGLVPLPLVLRINAIIDVVVGVVLLAATWDGLYEELDTVGPVPWIWAQIAGGLLLGFAYLTWRAADDPAAARPLVQVLSILNIGGFALIAVWLFSDDHGIPSSGSLGSWVIDIIAVVTLVLGIMELRAFRRTTG